MSNNIPAISTPPALSARHTMVDGGAGYQLPVFSFLTPPELAGAAQGRYPVVIVGGGLAGLTLACDLATRGVAAVVLDEDDTVGVRGASSRGMCYVQKSLEVFDRLGIYERLLDKGVQWSVGRTLVEAEEVYTFDARLASLSAQVPFLNLQQFYLEWFLVDRIAELGLTDLRWKHRVTGAVRHDDHVVLQIDTPEGAYAIGADWVIDATGANSPLRDYFGVQIQPEHGTDRWCICDVRFKKPLPVERWTWVAAPFNEGRAVWQHPMADDVWRLDYQMAPDCDPERVSHPDVARERVCAHLGEDVDFEMVWIGPWHYRTQMLDHFRLGRVLFIGDAAHAMSPFGARGGNSGIQDADNLGWKLALVLGGNANDVLLDSYCTERRAAAAENIAVTKRTARFLAPQSEMEWRLRDAVLSLARTYPFARELVNTGRLCVPNRYPCAAGIDGAGESVQNLVVRMPQGLTTLARYSLSQGTRLLALYFPRNARDRTATQLRAHADKWPLLHIAVCAPGADLDDGGTFAEAPGTLLLLRPDLYRAARLQAPTPEALDRLLAAALGEPLEIAP
ncbi:3-(3-hydroxy-phenyl)propionate hydroxylase [Paraburkholderia sp. EB58]|uniref:FAD-dependent oxidoreductase n=1 Tax=Paraburkholderia sp. EB58 TaxID=3035125 RepID=UPI003D25355A